METDIKRSSQFESEKSSVAYESETELFNEPKTSNLRFALVFTGYEKKEFFFFFEGLSDITVKLIIIFIYL